MPLGLLCIWLLPENTHLTWRQRNLMKCLRGTLCTLSPCSTQRHSAVQQLPAKTQLFVLKRHWHSCVTSKGAGASIIRQPKTTVSKGWGRRNEPRIRTTERSAKTGAWGGLQEGESSSSSCSQRHWVTSSAWAAGRNTCSFPLSLSGCHQQFLLDLDSAELGNVGQIQVGFTDLFPTGFP